VAVVVDRVVVEVGIPGTLGGLLVPLSFVVLLHDVLQTYVLFL
jgi:hypothetical protein